MLDELAELFVLRALNHVSEDAEPLFDEHCVTLITKKVAPRSPAHLRPITILSVLFRLYSATLLHIVSPYVKDLSRYQHAVRPRRQADEVIFILRQLIEKANEWDLPLYVLDGDLPKAYDNVLHPIATERLLNRGFPKFYVSMIIRGTRRPSAKVKLNDLITPAFRRTKSIFQGGSDAPTLFNHIFDEDINYLIKYCRRRKWDYYINADRDGTYSELLPILVFADNFWFLAKSAYELQCMSVVWFSRVQASGWKVPVDECCWSTTQREDLETWTLKLGEEIVPRRSRDDAIQILGAYITMDGRLDVELDYRLLGIPSFAISVLCVVIERLYAIVCGFCNLVSSHRSFGQPAHGI